MSAAAAAGVPWGIYGRFSAVHICMNPELQAIDPLAFVPEDYSREELQRKPPELLRRFRLAMLVNGVDLSGWPGGLLSVAHTDEDVAFTLEAFRTSLAMLKREEMI